MPTPTEKNTQAIEELARTVAVLLRRADENEQAIEQLTTQTDRVRSDAEQTRIKLAVLEHAVDELRKSHQRWGGRAWQLATGAGLLILGAVLGYVLKR